MLLTIRHVTRYVYEPPAQRASLRLKLFPPAFAAQQPRDWRVSINGEPIAAQFVNAMGEGEAVWTASAPLAAIDIEAAGNVETVDTSGIARGLADRTRPAMFLRETPLTAANPAIRELGIASADARPLATLHNLLERVRDAVDYAPRATGADTTAADALALGRGVCQDHAHIFIAAARAMGVPARYVAGYLTPDFDGQHETHAWAEAYVPDLGWVGFDPANRQGPTESYIRLCAGLDAVAAAPIRGLVGHGAGEGLSVTVEVAQQ